MTMKLSEAAKKYAESIYRKAFHQASVDGEAERREIRARSKFSNLNIPQMSDHFVSLTKRLVDARLDSYIKAYKQDDLLIDEEDKDEIIEEIRRIIKSHVVWVTTDTTIREFRLSGTNQLMPDIESSMTERLNRILGEATLDLDLARNEMIVERKNTKPELPVTHYSINVHGHNYGNIQQGGENNTQIINERSALSFNLDIPPSLYGFVGRAKELSELGSLLEQYPAINVEGLSGIGKTSLVLSLANKWLTTGRLSPNGFFYFDCAQRNMRLEVAAEFLLGSLSAFLMQVGASKAALVISNEQHSLDQRYNALVSTLAEERFLLFLDNLQDALNENGRLASKQLSNLLHFILSRPIGDSRFICASYVQCFWSSRIPVQPFRLNPLSPSDARSLFVQLGLTDIELATQAAELVGRHPQAIRWFSVLPRELKLTTEEVINDLTKGTHNEATGNEFQQRIEQELLNRIWDTLPADAGHLLSLFTVFRRPVPFDALYSLNPTPSVDRWRQVLLDRFLLNATKRDGPHSLHAIVREFAERKLAADSDSLRNAHRQAARWWRGRSNTPSPSTQEELEVLIEEHYHLSSAGEMEEAEALAKHLRPFLHSAGRDSYRQGMNEENEAINRALLQTSPNDSRAHFYLANVLVRRGKKYYEEAEQHFKRALELNSNFSAARNMYAMLLAKRGHSNQAEDLYLQSISTDPKNPKCYSAYARFLARERRTEEAETQFLRGIDANPDDAVLRSLYAKFLVACDEIEEAEIQFQSGLRAEPDNVTVRHAYASFLIDQKQFKKAETQLNVCIEIDPSNINSRRSYIKLLILLNRYDEANAQYKDAIGYGLKSVYFYKAYIKFLAGKAPLEEAEARLKAAISADPKNQYIRAKYIKYLIKNGRLRDAEEHFRLYINTYPDNAAFRKQYAEFLAQHNRSNEAEEQFIAGINMQPENALIRKSYISFLALRRRFDEAEAQFREILKYNPMSANLQKLSDSIARQKSFLQMAMDDPSGKELISFYKNRMWNLNLPFEERVEACKNILIQNPEDAQANYCIGRTLFEQGKDAQSAEVYLRKAKNLDPDNPDVPFRYGQVLERLERYEDALSELDTVVRFHSENAEFHNSRANCLKQLKRWTEAEAAYREAIHISKPPWTAKFLNNLALLFSVWPDTSRIKEGIQLCDKVKAQFPKFPWTDKTRASLQERLTA